MPRLLEPAATKAAHFSAFDHADSRLVKLCSATHVEHIVRANEAAGGVDVFVHSWNPELASVLDRAYAPHLRSRWEEPTRT